MDLPLIPHHSCSLPCDIDTQSSGFQVTWFPPAFHQSILIRACFMASNNCVSQLFICRKAHQCTVWYSLLMWICVYQYLITKSWSLKALGGGRKQVICFSCDLSWPLSALHLHFEIFLLHCSPAVFISLVCLLPELYFCLLHRTRLASTHCDHTVRITEIRTGKCTHILTGHPRTPWSIAYHPSSNDILATGCLAGEVRIWDLRVRQCTLDLFRTVRTSIPRVHDYMSWIG